LKGRDTLKGGEYRRGGEGGFLEVVIALLGFGASFEKKRKKRRKKKMGLTFAVRSSNLPVYLNNNKR